MAGPEFVRAPLPIVRNRWSSQTTRMGHRKTGDLPGFAAGCYGLVSKKGKLVRLA